MKKIYFSLCFLPVLFSACDFNASQTVRYQINEPIVIPMEKFRNSVQISDARNLTTIGKMCFYNGYLYISDPRKGIHIIDNQNPEHPQIKSYIELQGNSNLCIHNNRLYADAWIDLLWFDLSNPAEPRLEGRLLNAFSEVLPEIPNIHPYDYELVSKAKQNGVVVGWELKTYEKQELPVRGNNINSSNAQFGLTENYLYVIIQSKMYLVDLSGEIPLLQENQATDAETIYPYKNNLFLGTPLGMFIYSLEDPLNPKQTVQIPNLSDSNPIAISDNVVYASTKNELVVIDVSDANNPKKMASYPMHNPKGLGINRNLLFLCDNGLKIFRLDNPQDLTNEKNTYFFDEQPLADSYNVIPWHNQRQEFILMMVSKTGLYQYDYSEIFSSKNIRFLSVIPLIILND